MTAGAVPFKSCSVYLNDVCSRLLLDTGAGWSLLNMDTYTKFFSSTPLAAPSTALYGYGGSGIDLVGSIQLSVRYGTKTVPGFVFQVARRGANLMGLEIGGPACLSGPACC